MLLLVLRERQGERDRKSEEAADPETRGCRDYIPDTAPPAKGLHARVAHVQIPRGAGGCEP